MTAARFDPARRLEGELRPPADKSISHRAAIFGAMAETPVAVRNYLVAADTTSTLNAVRAVGARVESRDGELEITGVGLQGADAPADRIDVGNAGTLMRLLPGWLAAQEGRAFVLDGDESIRRRPVDRIATPLGAMGASIAARDGRLPPFTVTGARLRGITYERPVASAQIKSAIALAALNADGPTTIVEPAPSRDHTERMLAAAGVAVRREGTAVTIEPAEALALDALTVPGDPSSAAFAIAAALIVPGSRVTIRGTSMNWTRTGFVRIAQWRCSAASPTARRSSAARTSCASRRPTGSPRSSRASRGSAPRSRAPTTASSCREPAACAAARSPRTATTAWRCSAPSRASRRARASRSTAWTRPP
jgi:3-phosphoshikimate 1-carboxyvinyltransferase